MATILAFRPRPATTSPLPQAIEAEIILFPGIRYEIYGRGRELPIVSENPKLAET